MTVASIKPTWVNGSRRSAVARSAGGGRGAQPRPPRTGAGGEAAAAPPAAGGAGGRPPMARWRHPMALLAPVELLRLPATTKVARPLAGGTTESRVEVRQRRKADLARDRLQLGVGFREQPFGQAHAGVLDL